MVCSLAERLTACLLAFLLCCHLYIRRNLSRDFKELVEVLPYLIPLEVAEHERVRLARRVLEELSELFGR